MCNNFLMLNKEFFFKEEHILMINPKQRCRFMKKTMIMQIISHLPLHYIQNAIKPPQKPVTCTVCSFKRMTNDKYNH